MECIQVDINVSKRHAIALRKRCQFIVSRHYNPYSECSHNMCLRQLRCLFVQTFVCLYECVYYFARQNFKKMWIKKYIQIFTHELDALIFLQTAPNEYTPFFIRTGKFRVEAKLILNFEHLQPQSVYQCRKLVKMLCIP